MDQVSEMRREKNVVARESDTVITLSVFNPPVNVTDLKSGGQNGSAPAAAADYDPFAERNRENAYSDYGALAHLLKSALSSGFLVMPNAFKNAGLGFGLVSTFVIAFIFNHTIQLLVRCSQELCRRERVPVLAFAETAEAAFKTSRFPVLRSYSTFAKNFVNVGILSSYYGASSVYLLLLATSVQQVCRYYVPAMAELDIRYYLLMPLPILLVLGVLRELKYLVPFSHAANVAVAISCGITLYYMFCDLPDIAERKNFATVAQLPIFFSIAIFAMECIGVVLPVENSMKKPSHFLGCPGVLNIGFSIVVGLYAMMGFVGYWKYGEDTMDSITLNLPLNEILAQSVNVLIALATLVTFGLAVMVPNNIALSMILKKVSPKRAEVVQYVFRIFVVLASVSIAVAIPKLQPIVSLVGAVFLSVLGLFCPPILEIVVFWDEGLGWKRWRMWKDIFIAAFSLFGLATGCYASIVDIINTV
ncbi:proton-coupled amino acid transporter-like protein pathetic isoform X1 [Schistocerca americana]|uniref:proton-coupled amino acid transporter-like protein pathetic isoform X1 n=2 Tax=Schistocerca americana TaxID=7009 RepID=UPI001F4FFF37|nr:proton-coupled amino acid transporter-like protein pathetic isoform X1 [Schistocerca americana]